MPPKPAAFRYMQLLVLAGLVCDAAAGLASGLARGLALTAAAVLSAVAEVTGFDGLNVFHSFTFRLGFIEISISQEGSNVNDFYHFYRPFHSKKLIF